MAFLKHLLFYEWTCTFYLIKLKSLVILPLLYLFLINSFIIYFWLLLSSHDMGDLICSDWKTVFWDILVERDLIFFLYILEHTWAVYNISLQTIHGCEKWPCNKSFLTAKAFSLIRFNSCYKWFLLSVMVKLQNFNLNMSLKF